MAKKLKKRVSDGIAHIYATFNNTIVSFTDRQGNTLCWQSAGQSGFKGARKSTPHAATVTAEAAARKVIEFGVKNLIILVRGPGPGRDSAIRALMGFIINERKDAAGDESEAQGPSGRDSGGGSDLRFNVTEIADVTSIPHNGCRPPKRRRV